jgi:hypothetical protein
MHSPFSIPRSTIRSSSHLARPSTSPASSLFIPLSPTSLDDHLSNTLPAECFATHEALSFHTGQSIESSSNGEEYRRGNKTRSLLDETEPLDDRHDEVDSSAHIVCRESPHEGVKLRRCRADAHEEWYFNEDNEERARAVRSQL